MTVSHPVGPGDTRTRIVVLGAGFAGAYCASELSRRLGARADILVLDAHNYFVFYPLLVEAGSGSLEPRHAVVPIRDFLGRGVRFRLGEVLDLDTSAQTVGYRIVGEQARRTARYDHLVVALGSVTAFPEIPGLRENAWQVKSLGDAVALRDQMVQLMERANVAESLEERRRLLRFVVVGASFTGVEVAGEFHHFLHEGVHSYRNLKEEDVDVMLLDRGPRILAPLSESLARYAQQRLEKRGIRVLTGRTIRSAESRTVTMDDGTIVQADTLIWCGGISQNPRARSLPLPGDARGFIKCNVDGRVEGFQNIWAIGDGAINPRPKGGTYPATAQAAIRLGARAGANIARAIAGRATRPINFRDVGSLCALGGKDGVAQVFGLQIAGFAAWWLWRSVYLMKMPGLGRKFRVALDWTVDLFFHRDIVQLGLRRKGNGE